MTQKEKPAYKGISAASIGCFGTIIAAIIGGVFAVIAAIAGNGGYTTNTNTNNPGSTFESLTVEIEGPATAMLGQRTEYTVISTNAIRLVWTITNYNFDEKNVVDNVSPQHTIWVEPTNSAEVGNTFTIQAIVYDANGRSETAEKYFIVGSE